MFKQKLAIIIPTKNRPSQLLDLLKSISRQDVIPDQVIVVDGGAISAEPAISGFSKLSIDYVKSKCSLTIQRNIGIKKLKKNISYVAFFDDDIVIENDSLKNMMRFLESAPPDTGGASFNNISDAYKKPTFFENIFFVNSSKPGRILRSGFNSKLCSLYKTERVEWLLGGATVWRKNIFVEFVFDEWFSGYARYEDVDYSYRVGREYELFVVANAKVKHNNRLEDIGFSFALGKMQVVNRVYFVKKNKNLSVPMCYWACFGLFLNNAIKGIIYRDKRYIKRAKGNLFGFIRSAKL